MTTNDDLRLQQLVEQAADALADPAGRFSRRDLVMKVRGELADDDLDPHVQSAALDTLAESLVTGFGERRSPRRRRSGGLFHPDDVIKLGNGIWARMGLIADSDLVEWIRLSRRNRIRVDQADNEKQDYGDERLDAFRTNRDVVRLIDLERTVFGWTEDQAEPDFLPFDEDPPTGGRHQ
ncbi:hypothetical protein OG756_33965 [Streptomyces sp. NBC_01310]|uniref:hypothetical protein n=1 Tax=Streptomyces sp. NBC_01310 TaxID=2903820 RepID=UPI0035B5C3CB|nr:hypothetical protein OG756_33965 [Streptomyces sp. NBC_01310]